MKYSLGISNFLEEISSLSLSIVFLYFLLWSLRKAFSSLLAILWNSAFRWAYLPSSPLPFTSLLFIVICKASSDNHFAFLHFFSLGMVLIPASCTRSWTSTHSSSGTLSIRSNPLNLCVTSFILLVPWPIRKYDKSSGNSPLKIYKHRTYQQCQEVQDVLTASNSGPWEVSSRLRLMETFLRNTLGIDSIKKQKSLFDPQW